MRFGNCTDISSIASGTNNCTDNIGLFSSYKITLNAQGVGAGLYPPLESACLNDAGTLSGLTPSNFKIPLFTSAQDFLSLEVKAYESINCGGGLTLFNSGQSLAGLGPNAKIFNDVTFTTLYLRKVVPNITAGALPYAAPLAVANGTSANYKATMKVQFLSKNKTLTDSANYKAKTLSDPYPTKAQQKISTDYKLILGN